MLWEWAKLNLLIFFFIFFLWRVKQCICFYKPLCTSVHLFVCVLTSTFRHNLSFVEKCYKPHFFFFFGKLHILIFIFYFKFRIFFYPFNFLPFSLIPFSTFFIRSYSLSLLPFLFLSFLPFLSLSFLQWCLWTACSLFPPVTVFIS